MSHEHPIARDRAPQLAVQAHEGHAGHDGPGARTLVFLHGMSSHRGLWDALLEPLPLRRHRRVTYDLRGHGASEWVHPPRYDPPHHAEDLQRVLERYAGGSVALIAHSAGALAAAHYIASENARPVSALVWIDIDPCVPSWQVDHFHKRAQTLERVFPSRNEAIARIAAGIQKTSPELDSAVLSRFVAGMLEETPSGWKLAIDPKTYETWAPSDVTPLLSKYAGPALVVRGATSMVSSAGGFDSLCRGLRRSRGRVVSSGHFPMLEDPAALAREIDNFITTEAPGA